MYYYNKKTWTISNSKGFIVYRAYTEQEFKRAIKRFKAVRLEY